jgi:hypothetical protein
MSDNKEVKTKLLAEIDQIFDVTDVALNEWLAKAEEGNLQFPILLLTVAAKFNWDDKTMRENDPIVRKYVRNHPDWYVTRGAHGGIMKRSERDKKEAAKAAKDLAKKQIQEAIEVKVAQAKANSESTSE